MAISAQPSAIVRETRLTLGSMLLLLALAAIVPALTRLPGGAEAANFLSLARNRAAMTMADTENYYEAVQKKHLTHALHFVNSTDFRAYRYAPNIDWQTGVISTNKSGWVGPDRPAEKPPHTWRIAVLGDSLATGYRVAPEVTFVPKLEQQLDRAAGPGGERFEVMNFGCPGYSLTQIMDAGIEDVPPYHPDAYLVELSERSLFKQWDAHLYQIVSQGIDPRYDFLRRILKQAQVSSSDSAADLDTKLSPYRIELLRDALQQLQKAAAAQHVPVILMLFPTVEPGDMSARRIHDAQAVYAGFPVVDLTGAFGNFIDREQFLATHDDPSNLEVHPNGPGYDLILNDLFRQLRKQPAVWTQLTGLDPQHLPPPN